MKLVDWSGPLTWPAPRVIHRCDTSCATDREVRNLLKRLERASRWIEANGGNAAEVLRGAA